jgi:hypothetical protein
VSKGKKIFTAPSGKEEFYLPSLSNFGPTLKGSISLERNNFSFFSETHKAKAIPVQAWICPERSRSFRLSYFPKIGT